MLVFAIIFTIIILLLFSSGMSVGPVGRFSNRVYPVSTPKEYFPYWRYQCLGVIHMLLGVLSMALGCYDLALYAQPDWFMRTCDVCNGVRVHVWDLRRYSWLYGAVPVAAGVMVNKRRYWFICISFAWQCRDQNPIRGAKQRRHWRKNAYGIHAVPLVINRTGVIASSRWKFNLFRTNGCYVGDKIVKILTCILNSESCFILSMFWIELGISDHFLDMAPPSFVTG